MSSDPLRASRPAGIHHLPIRVQVSLAHAAEVEGPEWLESTESERRLAAVRDDVAAYVSELVGADLRIPITADVEIELAPPDRQAAIAPFRLEIAGEPAPMRVGRTWPLAEAIQWAVYHNRDLLVTRQTAEAMAAGWGAGDGAGPPPEAVDRLLDLLRRLCIRNVGLGPLSLRGPTPAEVMGDDLLVELLRDDEVGLRVALDPRLRRSLFAGSGEPEARAAALSAEIQQAIFRDCGVAVPLVRFEADMDLPRCAFRIHINRVRLPIQQLEREATLEDLRERVEPEPRRALLAFLSSESMERALDTVRVTSPTLVDLALARTSPGILLRILESLVEEGLSIRNLPRILEAITITGRRIPVDAGRFIVFGPNTEITLTVPEHAPQRPYDAHDYVRAVRTHLKREITDRYARRQAEPYPELSGLRSVNRTMPVYLMDPDIERRLDRHSPEPLTDAERTTLVERVGEETLGSTGAIVLTTEEAREPLARLIARAHPDVRVLCYTELMPELNLQPIARISL